MVIDQFKRQLHDFSAPALIMGVLNVTPDSFSDGGRFYKFEQAVARGLEMEHEGADIIDVGGESTRPGAEPISVDQELERVIPVIEQLRQESTICISIDTYKAAVAREALQAGADLVNDISGFMFDMDMPDVVRDAQAPVIIMHIKGTPRNMQANPVYSNLMQEIIAYFRERIEFSLGAGLEEDQLILDPGIGFGKRLEDNFTIMRELQQIVNLGYPVLIGPSRKSFIGLTLNLPPEERLEGTLASISASVMNGARIVRVHDVKAAKRALTIIDSIKGVGLA